MRLRCRLAPKRGEMTSDSVFGPTYSFVILPVETKAMA